MPHHKMHITRFIFLQLTRQSTPPNKASHKIFVLVGFAADTDCRKTHKDAFLLNPPKDKSNSHKAQK
jgi:hypothetical protein